MQANNWDLPTDDEHRVSTLDSTEEAADEISRTSEILGEILASLRQIEQYCALISSGKLFPATSAARVGGTARMGPLQDCGSGRGPLCPSMRFEAVEPMRLPTEIRPLPQVAQLAQIRPLQRTAQLSQLSHLSHLCRIAEVQQANPNESEGSGLSQLSSLLAGTDWNPRSMLAGSTEFVSSFEEPYASFMRAIDRQVPNAPALAHYLGLFCAQQKKMSTLTQLRSVLKQFCSQASVPPSRVDFSNYIASIRTRSAPSSLKQQYAIVKRFLQSEFGWTDHDFSPLTSADLVQRFGTQEGWRCCLSAEELNKIKQLGVPERGYPAMLPALVELMHVAGLTLAEVLQLRWNSLQKIESGDYFLQQQTASLTVPIRADLAETLLAFQGSLPSEAPMFPFSPTELTNHFHRLSEALGKKLPELPKESMKSMTRPSESTTPLSDTQLVPTIGAPRVSLADTKTLPQELPEPESERAQYAALQFHPLYSQESKSIPQY